MAEVLRGWPRPARLATVLALLAAAVALVMVQWERQADADRENERLYELCLSQAQDVANVKGCTADFYTRRDGRLGGVDPVQVSAESQRLVELRNPAPNGTAAALHLPPPAPKDPTAIVTQLTAEPPPEQVLAAAVKAVPEGPADTEDDDATPEPSPNQPNTRPKPAPGKPSPTQDPRPRPATAAGPKPGTTAPATPGRPTKATEPTG